MGASTAEEATKDAPPRCLQTLAVAALANADLDEKVRLTRLAQRLWSERSLSLRSTGTSKPPSRPGRPDKPELISPAKVPKRSLKTLEGRKALLHAISHIELNAIDLALDIVARFAEIPMPRSFFDGWMRVAAEEAKHFTLLRNRMGELDMVYGDLPAHDGLWEASQATAHDLRARLAVVPLVLEARGLDVTPSLIAQLRSVGDDASADIFEIIYQDEKGHVAVGAKWFRFLCQRDGVDPSREFQRLVRTHFRGTLRPPFNDAARSANGLTPLFYRSISPLGN